MKQSDIFALVLIAGIGTLASFFVCNAILGDPNDAQVKFKTISAVIEPDLVDPNPEIFNSTAINPTVEVFVGDCVDADRNGILDMTELATCGRVESAVVTVETPIEELESLRDRDDICISVGEDRRILCEDNKKDYINKLINPEAGGSDSNNPGTEE